MDSGSGPERVPNKIDYVEFAAADLAGTKAFFAQVFGWKFTDYGPAYTAFSGSGLEGGFYSAELRSRHCEGGALIVLYSNDLEGTLGAVRSGGGEICKDIFSFPGGRRFHFLEPSGNELAVWTEESQEAQGIRENSSKAS